MAVICQQSNRKMRFKKVTTEKSDYFGIGTYIVSVVSFLLLPPGCGSFDEIFTCTQCSLVKTERYYVYSLLIVLI